ncbi:MAG: hypothetical protein KKB82_03240, partial [Candidatus Omnitrophica bacterium]|nr:hypothetical protein [Candidatus Omnitrophota bacterium]
TSIEDIKSFLLPSEYYEGNGTLDVTFPWEQENVLEKICEDKKEGVGAIIQFAAKLIKDMEDINPRYSKLINDNFWDLF